MKRLVIWLLCCLCLTNIQAQQVQQSRLEGIKQPKAGSLINFTYSSKGGSLDDKNAIDCAIYMYNNYEWKIDDVVLTHSAQDKWQGSYQLPANCAFFALSFRTGDLNNRTVDNNDANGGYVFMTSDDLGKALPGGYIAYATFRNQSKFGISDYYQKFNISDDAELMWTNKEVQNYTNRMPDYINLYMQSIQTMAGKNYPKVINHFFEMAKKDFAQNEFVLATFENLYRFTVKDVTKADSIKAAILKSFPNGFTARFVDFHNADALRGEAAANAIEAFYNKYPYNECIKDPHSKVQAYMYYNLSRIYGEYLFKSKQHDKLIKSLPNFNFVALSEMFRWNVFRSWRLRLMGNDTIYPVAKALMDQMISKRHDLSNMEDVRYSPKDAQTLLDYQFYERLGMYIQLLKDLKKYDEAIQYFPYYTDEYLTYVDATVNQARYDIYKAVGKNDEAIGIVKKAVKYNTVTTEMINALRDYVKPTSEEAFQKYLDQLKGSNVKTELENEVKSNLKDVTIPAFDLLDSNGKTVHIADFKNKVVVIDFWANWCAPCKNAMEGMKIAVDKYADDKDVVFLFVNTMDNGLKGKPAVDRFIKSKSYNNFNVMYDIYNPSTKSYNKSFGIFAKLFNSSGIPRKVILKDGKMRYTAEGYSGSPSKLADEISCAVGLIKQSK